MRGSVNVPGRIYATKDDLPKEVTTEEPGLITPSDKAKLDNLEIPTIEEIDAAIAALNKEGGT